MDLAAAGSAARGGLVGTRRANRRTAFDPRPRPGGWRILDEPELHLGDETVVPDLAGWRLERMPRLPDAASAALAPDWVCEVLSPSTAQLDRARKLRIYAEHGVRHAWLVDPDPPHARGPAPRRAVDGRCSATHAGSAAVRAEPFEAIQLELGALWDEERASDASTR